MSRIVLDTNCLIQCLPRQSKYHKVWLTFTSGQNTLCVSNEILEEYLEIVQRLISPEFGDNLIKTIINSPFVKFVTPYFHFFLIKDDPDDDKYADCAVACAARCIVSNDHHFDVLKRVGFPKVNVRTLHQFYEEIEQKENFS